MYLQPILRDYFRRSNLALTSIYVDSTSALITSLLPMLRRKIFALLPQISNQPQLLSHLIHELMGFDVSLKDECNYDGGNAIQGWKGLTWDVLVRKDWFSTWLDVEKNCKAHIQMSGGSLTFLQLPYLDIRTSSTRRGAARQTTTASTKVLPNLPTPQSESTTSSKQSLTATNPWHLFLESSDF